MMDVMKQHFADAEMFSVRLPAESTDSDRKLLLGAAIMVEYQYYEGDNDKTGGGEVGEALGAGMLYYPENSPTDNERAQLYRGAAYTAEGDISLCEASATPRFGAISGGSSAPRRDVSQRPRASYLDRWSVMPPFGSFFHLPQFSKKLFFGTEKIPQLQKPKQNFMRPSPDVDEEEDDFIL
ncbi:unnamed protein product [Amoebophrya sp. A25]|nr:unnamed protein product [Amoebophrya sp. A25]|eukprot:GSA25T00000045001.1